MTNPDLILRPLGLRHRLEPRETGAGFASRLAAVNGRPFVDLLREMLIAPRAIDWGDEHALRDLAVLGSADPEPLLRYTPRKVSQKIWSIAGTQVPRQAVNRTYFRYCPCCVAEDLETFDGPRHARPWLRLEWTVSWFRSCDRHRIPFVVTSPERIPFAPFDFIATMRPLLSGIAAETEAAGSRAPSPFQAWLHRRLDGDAEDANWLDHMPVAAAADFCEALGLSALQESKVQTTRLTENEWSQAADEGFRVASAGPESIRALLDSLNAREIGKRGYWTPRDTYGWGYAFLDRRRDDPAYAEVCEIFRTAAFATMPLKPGSEVLGHAARSQTIHSIYSLAQDSGIGRYTIRTLLNRHQNDGAAADRHVSDNRILLNKDEALDLIKGYKGALSVPAIARMTGIQQRHLVMMIANGWLQTRSNSGNVAFAKHRVGQEDVAAMLDALIGGAEEVDTPEPHQVDVETARQNAVCSLEEILRLVFDGKLSWKGRLAGRHDYDALLVDVDEVRHAVPVRSELQGLLKLQMKEIVRGIDANSIPIFIDRGDFQTMEEIHPLTGTTTMTITRESATAFSERYIALGEMCQDTGLHRSQIMLIMRAAGIDEVFDKATFMTVIYRREEVEKAQRDDPGFWRYDKARLKAKVQGG